ncbi:hypothetical protein FB451DRAFT_1271816 [Mycena latifolia]|nr:hypothetical protein FB451DRAFT_1271816 [Mycena latifolia]
MSTISSTVSPSSPAVTPDTKVAAAADKDTLLAASSPTLASVKDLRAFEHDRQRVKKAADLVKMRARKGQGRWGSLAKGELYNSSRKSAAPLFSQKKQERLGADEVSALDGSLADSCEFDGVASRDASKPSESEVKLSDLLTFGKPRKGLGTFVALPSLSEITKRATDGDFVVIPHRSVIVLDDFATHDVMVDEPWEHMPPSAYT